MPDTLKLLIVEDSEEDTYLLIRTLQRGGMRADYTRVDTEPDMRAALEDRTWDAILSDHAMPRFSATAALALAKAMVPDTPFLILSGEMDLDLAISLMKDGAEDYIQKNEINRILPAIERVLREAEARRKRRQTEHALRESEELYRRTLESISDAVLLTDDSGQIKFLSPQAATIFGRPEQEIREIGSISRLLEIFPSLPGGGDANLPIQNAEFEISDKAGARRTLLINVFPISIKDGTRLFTLRDITELHHTQIALRESEEHYRSLFHNNHAVMLVIDPDSGAIVDANPAAGRFYGYSEDALCRKNILEINTLTPEAIRLEMENARTGQRDHFLFQHRLADGDIRDVEVYSGPITIRGRHLLYSVVHDITERKRTQCILEERIRFETLFADLSTTFLNLSGADVEAAIVQGLQRLAEFQGVDRGSLFNLTADPSGFQVALSYASPDGGIALPFLSHEQFPWLIERLRQGEIIAANRLSDAPQEAHRERDFCRQTGVQSVVSIPLSVSGQIWGAITFVAVRQPRAWPPELIARLKLVGEMFANTLERSRAEQKIQSFHSELELRIEERTLQLQAANRELEAFVSSVSHDLRAPLRAILGYGDLLQKECSDTLSEQGRIDIDRIRTTAAHMHDLVDGLLALSHLSRRELQIETVDLSRIARAQAEALNLRDPKRIVEWIIAEDVSAQADRGLIHDVLANLLDNAWKFTARRRHARIEFGASTQPDGRPAFFVRDNGTGFSMQESAKLFQIFQRLHDAADFPGNGIGLATVQRIIDRHGGRIWAEAKPDRGAEFIFTL